MRQRSGGFTILELLMVMGILGVLAAISIYTFIGALNRAKQKRTMADIRSIALAWEARSGDTRSYNAAGASTFAWPTVSAPYSALANVLQPTYLKHLPQVDGWGKPFEFSLTSGFGSGSPAQDYGIRSAGRDGRYSGNSYSPGPTSDYDADIVYSAGTFVTYPDGVQGKD